jgi:hypothetical protein
MYLLRADYLLVVYLWVGICKGVVKALRWLKKLPGLLSPILKKWLDILVINPIKKWWNSLTKWLSSKWNAVKNWWLSLHPFYRQLPVNLIIGLSVTWLMITFQNWTWLMEAEDASMDWLMQVNQNIVPSIQESNIPPFVVLDIDDKTFQAWGEPLVIPRDKITHLIDAAVKAKARLILVTFDINRAIPFGEGALHPQDEELKNYLANYAADCQTKQNKSECPTIILFRAFQPYPGLVQTPRTGFLDETVEKAEPYIQWASAQFYSTNVIRRGKLWVRSCTADEQPEIVPSMELLAMSKIRGCSTEDLQKVVHPLQLEFCKGSVHSTQKLSPKSMQFCRLTVNTEIRGTHPQIKYRMAWLIDEQPPALPYLITDELDIPTLVIFAAQSFTESTPKPAYLEALTKSIVLIGESYREAQAIQSTPLGDMPNSLILINSLYSLLEQENTKPSEFLWIVDILIIIVFIGIISRLFCSFWGIWGAGIIMLVILLPLFLLVFNYGTWFTFALPLIVISIFHVFINHLIDSNK